MLDTFPRRLSIPQRCAFWDSYSITRISRVFGMIGQTHTVAGCTVLRIRPRPGHHVVAQIQNCAQAIQYDKGFHPCQDGQSQCINSHETSTKCVVLTVRSCGICRTPLPFFGDGFMGQQLFLYRTYFALSHSRKHSVCSLTTKMLCANGLPVCKH